MEGLPAQTRALCGVGSGNMAGESQGERPMMCPICGGVLPPTAVARAIAWCEGCGLGVTIPAPVRDVTAAGLFEEGSYAGESLERREQWHREARQRLGWVRTRTSEGFIIELGPATGEFVAAAERAGFAVVGLETSAWAAAAASDVTSSVVHSDLAAWRRQHPDTAVAAVCAFHVLEHVPRPLELLQIVRHVLTDGGLLFLEVPNAGCPSARRLGANWDMALVEDHFWHFDPPSLARLLAASGFEVLGVRTFSRTSFAPVRRRVGAAVRRALRGSRAEQDLLQVVAACIPGAISRTPY